MGFSVRDYAAQRRRSETEDERDEEQREARGSSGGSFSVKDYVARQALQRGGALERYNDYGDFLGRVNDYSGKLTREAQTRQGNYQDPTAFSDYYLKRYGEMNELLGQAYQYRDYFRQYGDLYGEANDATLSDIDKVISYLGGAQGDLRSERDYWRGFESEDAYNRERTVYDMQQGRAANDEIGQYGRGNIDLYNRPQYVNEDGKTSTVRSASFNIDGKEVLLPTVGYDAEGKPVLLTDDQALQAYRDTGEHLGSFDTREEADAYAEKLHQAQDWYYGSAYKSTANGQTRDWLAVLTEDYSVTGFDDPLYDAINGNEDAQAALRNQAGAAYGSGDGGALGYLWGVSTDSNSEAQQKIYASYAKGKQKQEESSMKTSKMQPRKKGARFSHLTWTQRKRIEKLKKERYTVAEIARALRVSERTIYRELKRGMTKQMTSEYEYVWVYCADTAQRKYEENMAAKGPGLKIGNDHALAKFLEDKMLGVQPDGKIDKKKACSPASALAAIREEGKEFSVTISEWTLYSYIDKGVFLNLRMEDLPMHGGKQKHKRAVRRGARAPRGDSIEERPAWVDSREEVGHWEMDSVVSARGCNKRLVVMTERALREELVFLVPDGTTNSVVRVLDRLERKMGTETFSQVFKTVTVDNGSEFADCCGMQRSCLRRGERTHFYYCHPYSSYERGSNENANRLIRRWYPKKTSFKHLTRREVKDLQNWMNGLPREILDWHSSGKLFREWLEIEGLERALPAFA